MDQQEPHFIEVGQGPKRRRIAYRFEDRGPGGVVVMWLSGFLSDMGSTKVLSLSDWARAEGHPMLRFDYSGHGLSEGSLLEAAIGDWLEEASAVLDLIRPRPVILVGSSMGGWVALLLARALAQHGDTRLAGLVLIAPAWDMTEKLMWEEASPEQRATIEREGVFYAPSLYGDPYPITRRLIEEGRNHLLAGASRSARPSASSRAYAIPTCRGVTRWSSSTSLLATTSSSPSSRTPSIACRSRTTSAAWSAPSQR